jgi:hypothetical protein
VFAVHASMMNAIGGFAELSLILPLKNEQAVF